MWKPQGRARSSRNVSITLSAGSPACDSALHSPRTPEPECCLSLKELVITHPISAGLSCMLVPFSALRVWMLSPAPTWMLTPGCCGTGYMKGFTFPGALLWKGCHGLEWVNSQCLPQQVTGHADMFGCVLGTRLPWEPQFPRVGVACSANWAGFRLPHLGAWGLEKEVPRDKSWWGDFVLPHVLHPLPPPLIFCPRNISASCPHTWTLCRQFLLDLCDRLRNLSIRGKQLCIEMFSFISCLGENVCRHEEELATVTWKWGRQWSWKLPESSSNSIWAKLLFFFVSLQSIPVFGKYLCWVKVWWEITPWLKPTNPSVFCALHCLADFLKCHQLLGWVEGQSLTLADNKNTILLASGSSVSPDMNEPPSSEMKREYCSWLPWLHPPHPLSYDVLLLPDFSWILLWHLRCF